MQRCARYVWFYVTGAMGLVGDEVELVVSGDPGSDTVIVLTSSLELVVPRDAS